MKRLNQRFLNTEITPAFINQMKPDAVILALGSSILKPVLPGINNAMHALDVYDKTDSVGQRVVIVGGGLVGCETGLHLAKTGHTVTIIEMLARLADESFGMYREALLSEMEKLKISSKVLTKCLEISSRGVKVETQEGKPVFLEADTVVYALGMQPNNTAVLKAAVGTIPVYEVGDCVRAAKVVDAVSEGFMAAMNIV